jgi:hypothetical protein
MVQASIRFFVEADSFDEPSDAAALEAFEASRAAGHDSAKLEDHFDEPLDWGAAWARHAAYEAARRRNFK